MSDPGLSSSRRTASLADERVTGASEPPTHAERWRHARRFVFWVALVPAAFAAYFWLPWPATWIETGLLLGLIACMFVIHEMSRF